MSAVRMPEWQRNVLRMFAHGRDDEFIAEALQVDVGDVAATITDLAGDDTDRAAQLVAAYDKQAELVGAARGSAVTLLGPGPSPSTRALLPPAAQRGPSLPPPPKPAPARETEPVDLASFDEPPVEVVSTSVNRSVLDRAARSDRARTRSLANKIRGLLNDLTERLVEEDLEREEAALRAAAIRESQRKVEELERELARARDALKEAGGRSHRKPTDPEPEVSPAAAVLEPKAKAKSKARQIDYDARTVRAWAAEHGVECPSAGRFLPKQVVEAWRRDQGAA